LGRKLKSGILAGGLRVMLLLAAALSSADAGTGTWTPLTNQPGTAVNNCLLLTDGRVICQAGSGRNWIALAPTNTGSYVNGTWSYIAPMQSGYAPLYHSSAVLPDGRVLIMGGEYDCSSGCPSVDEKNGSIYNPFTNTWTAMTAPAGWTTIGDAMGIVLADGTYMQADCCSNKLALLNATTLTWTAVSGTELDNYNNEEGWVLLPDGTVLNVDAWSANKNLTSRFNPTTGQWTSAGNAPVALVDNSSHSNGTGMSFELGPGNLRPDGTVFWIGAVGEPSATAHTAIYDTSSNTWSAGPDIPNHDGGNDSPSAVLPNGNVLFQVSPASNTDVFGSPSHFYEFDGSSITAVSLPGGCSGTCNFPAYLGGMLLLPSGEVLLTAQSAHVEVYSSSGSPNSSWLPTITTAPATVIPGETFTISGTQFNGLGAGATYGDDMQAATNYPLVRITNRATGHIFYARTHDHSTMGVATGSATVSTSFDVPASIETGASDIEVVANGIASAKTAITVSPTLTVSTLTADKASPQAAGTTITFTASASNGIAPYQYKWWLKGGAGAWTMVQDWSSSATFAWTPATANSYTVEVWARSANNNTDTYEAYKDSAYTVSVSAPLAVSTLTSDKASPQAAGTTITFTASASGGTSPYQYKWWVKGGSGAWTMVQNWSSSATFAWTPATANSYTVEVWARSAGNNADTYEAYRDVAYTISAGSVLTLSALATDKASPQAAGTTITFTASASGGTAPYQYKWWVKGGSGAWTMVQDWSSSATFAWTPATANSYTVEVWGRSAGNNANTYEAYQDLAYTITAGSPLTFSTTTTDKASPQAAGTIITFTANASGGTAPYQYKWWLKTGTTWSMVQDWSSSTTFAWTPGTANSYVMEVWGRSAGNNANTYEAYQDLAYTITAGNPLTFSATTTDKASPQAAGTTITFTANASGGTAPYQYKWWVRNSSGAWTMVQDWSSSTTFAWTPATAYASYVVEVWGRSAGNNANTYEAYKDASFSITP
jgi:hypothetical protein